MSNNQFLLVYNDLFKDKLPRDDNEGTLYKLMQVYDDNYYVLVVALNEFERTLKTYRKKGYNDKSFSLGVEVLYHMSSIIRMIATSEDILIKIYIFTQKVNDEKLMGDKVKKYNGYSIEDYRKEYNKLKLHKMGYPKLPVEKNRRTRKYRNDITHGDELMITKGEIKKKSTVWSISPEGVYNHNLEIFNKTEKEIAHDLQTLDKNRKKVENKIINLIDVYKRH
ncbi:hypothetical protein [Staphylococcus sp. LKG3-1]|uniref:hypothetical protein n=1 Tax=unclassified Staphylococcus TaxID=91994 RepID=UPI002970B039|nr:hypothetical protein [Staphylococcus saprophyticus]MDW4034577.1 hypothetical protein [Staphylococcus saprophyticus]